MKYIQVKQVMQMFVREGMKKGWDQETAEVNAIEAIETAYRNKKTGHMELSYAVRSLGYDFGEDLAAEVEPARLDSRTRHGAEEIIEKQLKQGKTREEVYEQLARDCFDFYHKNPGLTPEDLSMDLFPYYYGLIEECMLGLKPVTTFEECAIRIH